MGRSARAKRVDDEQIIRRIAENAAAGGTLENPLQGLLPSPLHKQLELVVGCAEGGPSAEEVMKLTRGE